MNREEFFYLLPYLCSLALSLGIFVYTWRHRQVRGAKMYAWFVGGQSLTLIGFLLELVSPNLQTKLLWDKFQWLTNSFLVFIPFLIFALQFSDHKLRRPRLTWGFWISIPVLFTFLLLTNSVHHLVYPNPHLGADYPFPELKYNYTIAVYLYTLIYIYGFNLYGISLLIKRAVEPYNLYRPQYWTIAIGFLIPLILSFFSLANIRIAPQRDLSPFSFAVGNLVVAWGLFRYKLFDIVPIARERIFENMIDPVVVLDAKNRVLDMNSAALTTLGKKISEVVGHPSSEVFAHWPVIVSELEYLDTEQREVTVREEDDTFFYDLNISSIYNNHHQPVGRVVVARDITKRKTLEVGYRFLSEELEQRVRERTEDLRKSAEQYRAVVENQTEFIVRWKPDGTRSFVNEAYSRYFGITQEQALSTDFMPLVFEEDRPAVQGKLARLRGGTTNLETEVHRVIKPDGSIGWQEWTDQVLRDEAGQVVEFQSVGRDVTERQRAEETILNQLAFDEFMTRLLTRFATCSYDEVTANVDLALREITEFLGGDFSDLLLLSDDKRSWDPLHRWVSPPLMPSMQSTRSIPSGTLIWSENKLLNGELIKINSLEDYPPEAALDRQFAEAAGIKSLLSVPIRGKKQSVVRVIDIVSYSRQITWTDSHVTRLELIGDAIANLLERKKAEDALRKSEEKFAKAFQVSPTIITITQMNNGKLLEVNEAFEQIMGYSRAEAIGKTTVELNIWRTQADRDRFIQNFLANGQLRNTEVQFRTKIGEDKTCLCSAELIELEGEKCFLSNIEDITERKKAEARILRLNRLYATINQINQTIVHARDKDSLFQKICRVTADHSQFRMAWIGLLDETEERINPMVFAGEERGYLTNIHIKYQDQVLGRGPTGTAIREGYCIICQDIANDPRMLPWREQALSRGYRSSAAVPFRESGRVIGALTVYASEPQGFDAEDKELLEQIGQDVSFALDSINAEVKRERAEADLAAAYDTTLEGWAKALELRDKETEGHSRRVTETTVTVARAIGFDEQELLHIRRGSILHDIGKMGIPDDILRKNGSLTAEERSIVNKHPNTAFELLKPIAYLKEALEIPYCHHEKWDGTGYPRGLRGEQIPLSARIFAVVDVWDALSSDRPYRNAWPPEKVAQYMLSEAGKHFDPNVVTIFLKMVEKGEI